MEERREELEDEIARCEAEIRALELELATFKSAQESIRLSKRIEQNRARLAELMEMWEQITHSLEKPGEAVLDDI
jgi:hypothetical protein